MNYLKSEDDIKLTQHASRQSQRRGIGMEKVRLVLCHGDSKRMPGADGFLVTLTRKKVRKLMHKKLNVTPSLIDKCQGITLAMQRDSEGWFIKTVYHKFKRHREQTKYNVFRVQQKQYR